MRLNTKHKIVNILTAIFFTNAMVMPIAQPIAYAEEVMAEATNATENSGTTNATSATNNLSTGTSGTTENSASGTTNDTATESSGTTQSDATNVPSQEKIESGIQTYLENFDKWSTDDKAKFAEKYGEYIYTLYRENSTEDKQTYIDKLKNAQTVTEAKAILEEGTTYTTNNIPSAEWTRQLSNWSKLSEFDRMNVLKERINDIDKEGLLSKAGVDNELIKKVIDSSGFTVKQLDNFITDYIKAQTQVNETSTTAETKKCPTGYFEVADVGKCCPNGSYFDSETQMCKTDGDSSSSSDGRSSSGSNIMSGILPLAGILMKGGLGSSKTPKEEIKPTPENQKEANNAKKDSFNKGIQDNHKIVTDGVVVHRYFGTIARNGNEDYLWDADSGNFVFSSQISTNEKQYFVVEFKLPNEKFKIVQTSIKIIGDGETTGAIYAENAKPSKPVLPESNGTTVYKRFAVPDLILSNPNPLAYNVILYVKVQYPNGQQNDGEISLNRAILVMDSVPKLGNGKTGAKIIDVYGYQVTQLDKSDWQTIKIDNNKEITYENGVCKFYNDDSDGTEIQVKVGDGIKDAEGCKSLNGKNFNKKDFKKDGMIVNEIDLKGDSEIPEKYTDMKITITKKDGSKDEVSLLDARFNAFKTADGTQYVVDMTTNKIYDMKNDPQLLNGADSMFEVEASGDGVSYKVKDKATGKYLPLYGVGQAIEYSKEAEDIDTKNRQNNNQDNQQPSSGQTQEGRDSVINHRSSTSATSIGEQRNSSVLDTVKETAINTTIGANLSSDEDSSSGSSNTTNTPKGITGADLDASPNIKKYISDNGVIHRSGQLNSQNPDDKALIDRLQDARKDFIKSQK